MKTLMNLMLASMCALSATACARPLVDLSVVDRDTGNTLQTYFQHGRRYVPGEPGHRYALRLSNHTGERVMVVLSVDGVNAVTGQTAGADQNGYVLDPWQTTEIAGWRKSYSDIAQFVFTAIDDSYASRTGRPDNVGVIGMAVFRESRPQPVYQQPMYAPPVAERQDKDEGGSSYDHRDDRRYAARDAAPAAPPASMAAQAAGSGYATAKAMGSMNRAEAADSVAQEIGTGHGDREYAPTSQTDFNRLSSSPQQVTQLFYDTPQQLVARGIMPRYYAQRWPRERDGAPQAFPTGFVPDPSW